MVGGGLETFFQRLQPALSLPACRPAAPSALRGVSATAQAGRSVPRYFLYCGCFLDKSHDPHCATAPLAFQRVNLIVRLPFCFTVTLNFTGFAMAKSKNPSMRVWVVRPAFFRVHVGR
jgi:hypothetical protein